MTEEIKQIEETKPDKPATPMTQIDNVSLEKFEHLVYTKRYEEAGANLLTMCGKLFSGAEFIGYSLSNEDKLRVYTRLAAALTTLFGDEKFQMSENGYATLAAQHAIFEAIFDISAFENSDHLVTALTTTPEERDASKLRFDDPRSLAKFLALYCLNSSIDLNFAELFSKAAKTTLPVFLGMLASLVVLHPYAHTRREKLLEMGKYFENLDLPESTLGKLSDAYMYTSYGVRPDRHEIKHSFIKMIQKMIKTKIKTIPEKLLVRSISSAEKPTIMIPLEWFSSFHAMFRCYALSIAQLKEKFRLVAYAKEKDLDDVSRTYFDECIVLSKNVVLEDLMKKIIAVKPDIIYYPSIGMALWWVSMASVRLAPIQCMSLGHPASSFAPHMDYVFAEEGQIGDEKLFTEKVVWLPKNSIRFVPRPDANEFRPEIREHPSPVRIAIPAMTCKLNVPFLTVLQNIKTAAASRQIEYHFFANGLGVWHYQTMKHIQRWLPGSIVHGRLAYNEYMARMNQCDLHFSTFPFGGTNSIIDSLLLALPIVCLLGEQPFERFDALMISRVKLDMLIAQTPADYEKIAVKLITDDEYRVTLARQLAATDIRKEFFGEIDEAASFCKAMWHLYQHHEEIQAIGTAVQTKDYL